MTLPASHAAAQSGSSTHLTPRVTHLTVVPIAGRDGMLLNLSGAHGPFFTRNLVILSLIHI